MKIKAIFLLLALFLLPSSALAAHMTIWLQPSKTMADVEAQKTKAQSMPEGREDLVGTFVVFAYGYFPPRDRYLSGYHSIGSTNATHAAQWENTMRGLMEKQGCTNISVSVLTISNTTYVRPVKRESAEETTAKVKRIEAALNAHRTMVLRECGESGQSESGQALPPAGPKGVRRISGKTPDESQADSETRSRADKSRRCESLKWRTATLEKELEDARRQ